MTRTTRRVLLVLRVVPPALLVAVLVLLVAPRRPMLLAGARTKSSRSLCTAAVPATACTTMAWIAKARLGRDGSERRCRCSSS